MFYKLSDYYDGENMSNWIMWNKETLNEVEFIELVLIERCTCMYIYPHISENLKKFTANNKENIYHKINLFQTNKKASSLEYSHSNAIKEYVILKTLISSYS